MKLKDLMVDTKSVWVEFPGCPGFEVEVVNLSRKELVALQKRCMKQTFDRKTRQAKDELDDEKFVREFTGATIKNWKGFKGAYLEDLLLTDLPDDAYEKELDYSPEDAEVLVSNSTAFDNWLNDVVFDLDNFRNERNPRNVGKTRKVAEE